MIRTHPQYRSVALLLIALLSGCGAMQKTLEQRIEQGQSCQAILTIEYLPDRTFIDDLLKARLGAIEVCPNAAADSTQKKKFIAICQLEAMQTKYQGEYSQQATSLRESANKLQESFIALEDILKKGEDRLKTTSCMSPQNVKQPLLSCMALPLAEIATQFNDQLVVAKTQLAKIDTAMRALANLSEEAKTETGAWIRNTETSLKKISAMLSNKAPLLKDAARNYATHYSARYFINTLHRSMKQLDSRFDKVDDKAYGLLSTGNFIFSGEINEKLYETLNPTINRFIAKINANSAVKTAVAVELAKGACERIDGAVNPSVITDLLDAVIIEHTGIMLASDAGATTSTTQVAAASPSATIERNLLTLQKQRMASYPPVPVAAPGPANLSTPTTSTNGLYQIYEWEARRSLLESAPVSQGWRLPNPVDELAVERLAEAAVAPVIDTAWLKDTGPPSEPNIKLPSGAMDLSVVRQNIVQTIPMLSNINVVTVSNQNTFTPTFSPIVNYDTSRPLPSLCNEADLTGVYCTISGQKYSLRPQAAFASGACCSPNKTLKGDNQAVLLAAVSSIGKAAAAYAKKYDIAFSAQVTGFTSSKEAPDVCKAGTRFADLAMLKPTSPGKEASLQYQSRVKRLPIRGFSGCRPNQDGPDGNLYLGAARAAWAAYALESAGNGALAIDDIASGDDGMPRWKTKDDAAGDRTVRIELTPVPVPRLH